MFPKFSQRAFPWTVQKNLTQLILDFKMKPTWLTHCKRVIQARYMLISSKHHVVKTKYH